MLKKRFIEPGDVIIIDAEGALSTKAVQGYLAMHNLCPFVLPTHLHQLLNPCDNSFHSIFKRRYYRIISNMNQGNMDVAEKFKVAEQCFHGISVDSVVNMFRKCGLIGADNDKREKVISLMCEGIKRLGNHYQYHKKCLLAFVQWSKLNNSFDDLCPYRINVDDIAI